MTKALAFLRVILVTIPGIRLLISEEDSWRCEIETTLKPMQNKNHEKVLYLYQIFELAELKVVTRLHSAGNVNIEYVAPVDVTKNSARSTPPNPKTLMELAYEIRYALNVNLTLKELLSTG